MVLEPEEVKTLFLECIALWGAGAQVIIAIEELAELQVVLVKGLRWEDNEFARDVARADIAEELADVKIMIQQIEVMYNLPSGDFKKGDFSKLVEDHRQRKLQRLRKRLETDKALR